MSVQVKDTRSFTGGRLHVSAVPFQTGADIGVDDHRKYLAVSTHAFPVPRDGTLVLSADVKASTPGTVPGLTQLGVYGPSGSWLDPARPPTRPEYTARRLQGQQAGVVVNVLDFCTGQVFDWFIASDTAFAQIIREIPVAADQWHHLDIALTRHDGMAWVEYFLDHQLIAHVEQIGHGLFSLLDAFPFQHPEAPDLSVSIPAGVPPTAAQPAAHGCSGRARTGLLATSRRCRPQRKHPAQGRRCGVYGAG